MIAIPAIDIREGACVQLVGGCYEQERVRLDDPVAVVRSWTDRGFRRLHVVDLDAATERGSNALIVDAILKNTDAIVEVGGGVRSIERLDALVESGARYVVLGTRAVESPGWLAETAERHPDTVIVAADVRGRELAARGWRSSLGKEIGVFAREIDALPLAGMLVTAVHVEGQMSGPDLDLIDEIVATTSIPVIASGGIATISDLRALASRGVAGAVIGMALYTGALDAGAVAEEFGATNESPRRR